MKVQVELVGTGSKTDPFRVNLPTYQMVQEDLVNMTAVVIIPDADIPPSVAVGVVVPDATVVPLPPRGKLPGLDKARWHNHLDGRYAEHAGRFRPEKG